MSEEQTQLNSADFQAGQAEVPAAPQVEIDPSLIQKVQALRALATAHNLLDKGMFPHAKMEAVRLSLDFLRALHEQMKQDALAHQDADKVQELVDLKGAQ